MTTATLEAPTTTRSRAVRATGYTRLGCGPLAAGQYNGHDARLVLPLELPVAVDARVRTFGHQRTIRVAGAERLASIVTSAAEHVLDRLHIDVADVTLDVRTLYAGRGTDLAEAVAIATDHALSLAFEHPTTISERVATAADATALPSAGLAGGRPAIVSATGKVLAEFAGEERLYVALVAPAQPTGASAVPGDVTFGTLATPTDSLAQWLVTSSAGATSPLAVTIADLVSSHEAVIGVIGGHLPDAPVAVLLHGDHTNLSTTQRICGVVREFLPDGWTATVGRTAATATI